MATKEDILEQIVEEYLTHQGYFVRHNVKFLPRPDHPEWIRDQDSNHSDIDVIGFNPTKEGPNRVWAVSCKSWQHGFDPKALISAIENDKVLNGRAAWKGFRELCRPKWSEAFVTAVRAATGTGEFTYVTAVTHLRGSRETWESYPPFRNAMNGNPVRVVTFREMITETQTVLTRTLAATEIGRMLQLFGAAGLRLSEN